MTTVGDTVRLSLTFAADDPETTGDNDNSTLTWTLAGTDADDFDLSTAGDSHLSRAGPDFEAPTDSGRNNVYEVTVQATDEGGQHGFPEGEDNRYERGREWRE